MDKVSGARMFARTLCRGITAVPVRQASRLPRIQPPQALPSILQAVRPFTSSAARQNDEKPPSGFGAPGSTPTAKPEAAPSSQPSSRGRNMMDGLADLLPSSNRTRDRSEEASSASDVVGQTFSGISGLGSGTGSTGLDDFSRMTNDAATSSDEYHFAVFTHKHNTHVTVSKPNGDVVLSMSAGNIGFRKGSRGSYDAAYQLGAHVCDQLYQRNYQNIIKKMHVTLRGVGQGREALTRILLGNEGRLLRPKITRVADNTRLKFGGTRSPRPRRL